jgi:hypothetical protein
MFQAILEFVWEYIAFSVLKFFWWLILFPVVWLVSLPIILMIAAFRRGSYWISVRNMLESVNVFWRDTVPSWGME